MDYYDLSHIENDPVYRDKLLASVTNEKCSYEEGDFHGLNGKDLVEIDMENFANQVFEADREIKRAAREAKMLQTDAERAEEDDGIIRNVVDKMLDCLSEDDYEPYSPEISDAEMDSEIESDGTDKSSNVLQSQGFATGHAWDEMYSQIVPDSDDETINISEDESDENVDISTENNQSPTQSSADEFEPEDGLVPKQEPEFPSVSTDENFYPGILKVQSSPVI